MRLKKIVPPHFLFFCFILISLTQPACKKTETITKIITDTLKHAWQPIPIFNISTFPAFGSASIGDSVLAVISNTANTTMPVKQTVYGSTFTNFLGYTSAASPAYGFPYINSKLCTYATAGSLNVQSVPVYNQYSSLSYIPTYTTGFYHDFPQTSLPPNQCYPSAAYPVIRNKYIITPVETDTLPGQRTRFDLLSFDSSKILSPDGFGDTAKVKRIYLQPAQGTIGFSASGYFCATFYDKFFIFYSSQFFRVDTLGNVKSFGYRPAPYSNSFGVYNMFTYGKSLFVNSGGILFSSTDQGETWSVFNDFSGSNVGRIIFRNVGDKLYATAPDLDAQLFKVAFSGKNLNFSELNNDGLQFSMVTSMIQCGRYDFITTATGVYYRDSSKVDQLKAPIR